MPFSSQKIRATAEAEPGITGFIGYDEINQQASPTAVNPYSASAQIGDCLVLVGLLDNTSATTTVPTGFDTRKNNTSNGFYAFTDDVWDGTNTSVTIDGGGGLVTSGGMAAFRGYVFDTIGTVDMNGDSTNPTPGSITLTSNDSIVVCLAGHYGGATASFSGTPSGYTQLFSTSQFQNDPDPWVSLSYITGISAGSYSAGSVTLGASGNAFLVGLRPV
jgi:hypothetical protein